MHTNEYPINEAVLRQQFQDIVGREAFERELYQFTFCNNQQAVCEKMKKVKEKEDFVSVNRPVWAEEGKALRERRESLDLPAYKAAEKIGISPPTLKKLEIGYPIQKRVTIKRSYETTLELFEEQVMSHSLQIQLKRNKVH